MDAASLDGVSPARPAQEQPVVFFIGDLHGHVSRVQRLWENLRRKLGPAFETATAVFLGDYCDRGPDTRGLIDWLLSLKDAHPQQTQVFLCGNHDFSFAAFTGQLPALPAGFDVKETWRALADKEEEEGWYKGPGYEQMHVQGRRWAGLIKRKISTKGRPYDESTFDSGSTFRSYGVAFADREALLGAMPQTHKDFLRNLLWVYKQDMPEGGDPSTSCSKYIAVHAGLEAGVPVEEQLERLRSRDCTAFRVEMLSGRANVYQNLPELEEENVLVVSGHHGVLDTSQRLRLVIDEGGGLDMPIAAIILPSREVVRDSDIVTPAL